MKRVKRRLYRGQDGCDARYEIDITGNHNEVYLRMWDVVGGDALVFLTPARARRLIDDLQPIARSAKPRRSR